MEASLFLVPSPEITPQSSVEPLANVDAQHEQHRKPLRGDMEDVKERFGLRIVLGMSGRRL